MKKLLAIFLIACISAGMITGILAFEPVCTIYIAGDSTAASYGAERLPLAGWGQALSALVPANIQIDNRAESGRSSKSFVDEGRLDAILGSIKEGDYFFIQFGHNDMAAEEYRHTDPSTTFKQYLKMYIDGAREKKATPILVTSIERRQFSAAGAFTPTLTQYAEATRQLAQAENVALIDLNAELVRYFNHLGAEGTKPLFLILEKGESPNYPDGIEDNSHLSEFGAGEVAKIALSLLAKLGLPISSQLTGIESPVPAIETENIAALPTGVAENIAEVTDEQALPEFEAAISELNELGVIYGYGNDDLRAGARVTRAEFSAILSRVLAPEGYSGSGKSFPDVTQNHWAWENINTLSLMGIVEGDENGYFNPNAPVTYEQAVKMVVEALGFGAEAETLAPYPWGYLLMAARVGATEGIESEGDIPASRGLVSKLILNSLYIPTGDDSGRILAQNLSKAIFYLSPNGSDDNDGMFLTPWKTLKKAATVLEAGQIVTLQDGEYYETEATVFKNSGTAENPIIVRAKTKHGARIVYPDDINNKMVIAQGADYVSIKNIDFVCEAAPEVVAEVEAGAVEEADEAEAVQAVTGVFVLSNASCTAVSGNRFSCDADIAVKLQKADSAIVEDNTITGGNIGIDVINSAGAIIRGNEIGGQTEVSVQLRGGTRNARVYNNRIYDGEEVAAAAIRIGGETKSFEAFDTAAASGFEAYNCVVWNNIISAFSPGAIEAGAQYMGARDCHLYNNIITGTVTAVSFAEPEGEKNGWGWSPTNIAPVFKNNIFANCMSDAYTYEQKPQGFTSNYNLFYRTYPEMREANSKLTDPFFEDPDNSDFRLMSGSPGVNTATVIPPEFMGFGGEILTLDMRDFNGMSREGAWHMGVYSTTSGSEIEYPDEEGPVRASGGGLLTENFDKPFSGWAYTALGEWVVQGGQAKQTDTAAGRSSACFEGGIAWTNYEFSADIKSPESVVDNVTGILFRSDKSMENAYCFRMYANNQLEFCRFENNGFLSIEKWDYNFTADTMYNLKVRANGNKFTFYVNNKQVREVTDDTFKSGTVGLYTFRQPGAFDNMRVVGI